MEKTYRIVWDDDLGPAWMNLDNLAMCLFSETHIGGEAAGKIQVEEVQSTVTVVNNVPCCECIEEVPS